jgi:glucosylglycerate synthase
MKVGQARLGAGPRIKRDGTPELSSILANIVGALYSNMEQTAEVWQRVRGSQPAPTFGLRFEAETEPSPADVNPMIESFRIGYESLREIWALVLPPASLLELKKISHEPAASFSITDELWARIVYDFAIGHRLGTVGRDHLLRALTQLYVGWAASFILSVKDLRTAQVEDRIERLALAYEAQKPYLISRWRWPDRFMP